MSNNDYIAPVDHGVLSTAGNVTVGAAGGAVKSFSKTVLWSMGIGAVAVAALFLTPFIGGTSLIGAVAAGAVGAGLGAAGGLFTGSFLGAFTGLFGAGKGALDAQQRVSEQKGAARAMEMQLAAYQAMAANNDNKYNLPTQGSQMNPAMARIDGASIDHNGTMVGQQLARA